MRESLRRFLLLKLAILGIAMQIGAPRVLAAPDAMSADVLAPIIATAASMSRDDNFASREVQLASQKPSGNAVNDTIYFSWYPARNAAMQPAPAVILLHPLGREDQSPMREYARYLSARGIAAAVMTLPYHGRRLPKGESSLKAFFGPNVNMVEASAQQSQADIRTVGDWMIEQPNVDAKRIGGIGISLGAILLHVAMGQDARISAGVAVLGGGDLAKTYRAKKESAADLARLEALDPMNFAALNHPRRVLMIQAARDLVVPPHNAEVLWKALGKPPIQWVDSNHFAPINLATRSIERASIVYLNAVWNGTADTTKIPRVSVPTLKFGFLSGLDSKITPAVQWQFFGLGTRRHMKLFTANAGISGRGPFLGMAATVNRFVDVGVARRLRGESVRPYVSFHLVY